MYVPISDASLVKVMVFNDQNEELIDFAPDMSDDEGYISYDLISISDNKSIIEFTESFEIAESANFYLKIFHDYPSDPMGNQAFQIIYLYVNGVFKESKWDLYMKTNTFSARDVNEIKLVSNYTDHPWESL